MTGAPWPAAPERCSVRADERGDPMLGTAFPAARLLLVEEPFPWGFQGLRTSRFDSATALAVEARAREDGIRVQAIRRRGRTPEGLPRRWMLVDTRRASRSVIAGEYTDDAELLELPFDGTRGEPVSEPLYLTCSHGSHDPCCGQRGRPLVEALASIRPEGTWQASHLGGCRFAPTVLVLPFGVMYGRVPPTAAADLVAATEAGELLGGGFLRGRIGVPPAAQAAIGFVTEQLGLRHVNAVSLVSTTVVDGATVLVRLNTLEGHFDVTVRRERVDASGLTCGAPGPSWFLAHTPVELAPVAA